MTSIERIEFNGVYFKISEDLFNEKRPEIVL